MQFDEYELQKLDGAKACPSAIAGAFNDSLADNWILGRLSQVSSEVANHLENYEISAAGDKIYHFVWDEFCDWYLEASKVDLNVATLVYVYQEILKLTHPLCPFITEQCWREMGNKNSLMDVSFPQKNELYPEALEQFATVQNIVGAIRTLRAEKGLNPKDKIAASIKSDEAHLKAAGPLVVALANLSEIEVSNSAQNTEHGATTIVDNLEIFVDIPFDEAAESARIEKDKAELEKRIAGLKGRLSNPSYTEKAPAALVDQTRAELAQAESELEKLIKS